VSTPIKLSGKNFQSFADFSIEIAGFTAVVGPSDLGKSATSRALKGILRNEIGAHHVRLGATSTEVNIEFDGHVIHAERTRKVATEYLVDGKEFKKLGQRLPEAMEDLGFEPITFGGVTIDPMFARQGDQQFLIDSYQSPTDLNVILGGFAATERLDKGKKAGNAQIQQKNSEAGILAVAIQAEEEQRSKILPLVEAAAEVTAQLTKLMADKQVLERMSEALAGLIAARIEGQKLTSAITLLVIPEIAPIAELLPVVENLEGLKKAYSAGKYIADVLSSLPTADTSSVEEVLPLFLAYKALAESQKTKSTIAKFIKALPNASCLGIETSEAIITATSLLIQAKNAQAELMADAAKLTGLDTQFTYLVTLYRTQQAAADLLSVHHSALKSKVTSAKKLEKIIAGVSFESIDASVSVVSQVPLLIQSLRAKAKAQQDLDSTSEQILLKQERISELENEIQRLERETASLTCPGCGTHFIPGETHAH
jgi:energy-coupling factor transporter ATP-binding protein EcfA2